MDTLPNRFPDRRLTAIPRRIAQKYHRLDDIFRLRYYLTLVRNLTRRFHFDHPTG